MPEDLHMTPEIHLTPTRSAPEDVSLLLILGQGDNVKDVTSLKAINILRQARSPLQLLYVRPAVLWVGAQWMTTTKRGTRAPLGGTSTTVSPTTLLHMPG